MPADPLWGALDIEKWQDTPCLRGRVANEQDVREGRAVFYLENPAEIGAFPEELGLPRCAILVDEDLQLPVVVIQAESAGQMHYIGYRNLKGGNGMGLLSDFQLLEEPDERFRQNP